jgi:hypothetical protein
VQARLQNYSFKQTLQARRAKERNEGAVLKAQIEFLVKLRDALQMAADATNDYLETLGPKDKPASVSEVTFTILKFDVMQGAKLGEYEVAYKASNIAEKWNSAYEVLRNSNATIQSRYHGKGYVYAYWLYGEGKIYRQRRKQRR